MGALMDIEVYLSRKLDSFFGWWHQTAVYRFMCSSHPVATMIIGAAALTGWAAIFYLIWKVGYPNPSDAELYRR